MLEGLKLLSVMEIAALNEGVQPGCGVPVVVAPGVMVVVLEEAGDTCPACAI